MDMAIEAPRRLALDIETISPPLNPDDDPDFDDPTDFELAAIGFAYDTGAEDAAPETDILYRQDMTPEAEYQLLAQINDEIAAFDPDQIVTYAGEFFDLPLLKQRPIESVDHDKGTELADNMTATLDAAESVDLSDPAADAYGYGTRLDDLIQHRGLPLRKTHFTDYDHGMDLDAIRPSDASTSYVDSDDVPGIMETWLHARSDEHSPIGPCNPEVTDALITDYVLGDIEHLLALADQLPFDH
jgi:hypothetical protein